MKLAMVVVPVHEVVLANSFGLVVTPVSLISVTVLEHTLPLPTFTPFFEIPIVHNLRGFQVTVPRELAIDPVALHPLLAVGRPVVEYALSVPLAIFKLPFIVTSIIIV